ncbi:hypothetical protein [Bacillus sp. NPDC077027]|uniref:hypothetical protein n=1 Tax=Bacillus sp. NPDC077027 TaxID=3390548 RepID=UPI003CFCE477
MKKSTWWIITVITVAAIAAIFFMLKTQEQTSGEKVKTKDDAKDKLLVSFTDQKLNNTYYLHGQALDTEKLTAYPSIAFDAKKRLLYFTSTDEATQKVSIQELHVKTGKKTTIYTGEDSVDSMRLSANGNEIYVRFNKDSGEQFYVAMFDLKKKRFDTLYPEKNNDDDTVSSFAYDVKTGNIAIQHYSLKEDYRKTDEANEKGVMPEPTTMKITLQENGTLKDVAKISAVINDISLSPDMKQLVYTVTEVQNNKETSSIQVLDLVTGQKKTLVKNQSSYQIISAAQPQFSSDGHSIYFMGIAKGAKQLKDDTGRKAKVRTIFEYDVKTKEVEVAWEKSGGIINNFTVSE